MVGHVSQFQLSQSYGRNGLLESAQFDSITISCAVDSGRWLFLFCYFFFLEMQNNSSQPKNETSTARKTRPTYVEKMAILEEIMQG